MRRLSIIIKGLPLASAELDADTLAAAQRGCATRFWRSLIIQ